MFVTEMLPMFVIVAVKTSCCPGAGGVGGQDLVMRNAGELLTVQVCVTFVLTAVPQMSRPLAVSGSVKVQELTGTMYWPVKLVPWPGSRRAMVTTNVLLPG